MGGGIVFENTFELTEATELNPEDAMKPQGASRQAQDAHAVAVQLREEGAVMGTAEVLQKSNELKNEGRSCQSRSRKWKRFKRRKVVNFAPLNKETK